MKLSHGLQQDPLINSLPSRAWDKQGDMTTPKVLKNQRGAQGGSQGVSQDAVLSALGYFS